MELVIQIVGGVSLLLGLISAFNFIRHPLSHTPYVSYTGGRFWIVALVCALALYLKG